MILVDRFERLLSWGEAESVYQSRRLYHWAIVLVVIVRPDVWVIR